jgi:hypothetical protein
MITEGKVAKAFYKKKYIKVYKNWKMIKKLINR